MTYKERIYALIAYRGYVVNEYTEHMIDPEQAAEYAMSTCVRLCLSAACKRYRAANGTSAGALVTTDTFLEIIDDAIHYLKNGNFARQERTQWVTVDGISERVTVDQRDRIIEILNEHR